ncbi:MAG: (d)CMP kinase [Alphaproteobacteria bacterium]
MAVVVAIDGPAASGKGTLARRLAERLGYAHLDTGKLYRAVARDMLDAGADLDDAEAAARTARALDVATLADPRLADDAIGRAASRIAVVPAVRAALLDLQRAFAARPPGGAPGAVLDGRDIGTVICPGADVKLFVDADVAVRARRRWNELRERGEDAIYAAVLQEMKERDARDASRAVAPMAPAEDACRVDTTEMDADAALAAVLRIVHSRLGRDRADN